MINMRNEDSLLSEKAKKFLFLFLAFVAWYFVLDVGWGDVVWDGSTFFLLKRELLVSNLFRERKGRKNDRNLRKSWPPYIVFPLQGPSNLPPINQKKAQGAEAEAAGPTLKNEKNARKLDANGFRQTRSTHTTLPPGHTTHTHSHTHIPQDRNKP